MSQTNNVILKGEGMYIRMMIEEDTELIVKWRNQDFVRKNFIYQQPFTIEGHHKWVENMINTGRGVQFIICTDEDVPVGSAYLRDIDREHRKAEYGMFLGEKEGFGHGYGSQAAALLIQYSFEELDLHKVMCRILAENISSRKSCTKAGYKEEAYLKDEVFLEGKFKDMVFMACINPKEL